MPTTDALLALRHRLRDGVLLDWTDLARMVKPPCWLPTRVLMEHWCCSQPQVSRRLRALWDAGLLDYAHGRGRYRIRRIGPPVTNCDNAPPTG